MDKVLKRRLIGASILIALAVIFVPMLLVDPDAVDDAARGDRVDVPPMPESARDVRRIPLNPESPGAGTTQPDPAERSRDAAAEVPPREQAGSPREQPADEIVLRPELDADAAAGDAPAGAEGEDVADAAGSQAGDPPADPAQPESESAPAPGAEADSGTDDRSGVAADSAPADEPPAAPPEASDDAAPSLGDYVVQVASFSSDEAANRIRARLEALGHIVQRDEIVRGQTLLYRLRTGPYPSREAAETALQQIATTVEGVEPIVRERDGVDGSGDGGFAVQVGSFVSRDNAESETGRLAELGFDAFQVSEQVGERLIWRVMVGPVDERDAAERLAAVLTERAGVEGLVVSHP
jgi:DedD protein